MPNRDQRKKKKKERKKERKNKQTKNPHEIRVTGISSSPFKDTVEEKRYRECELQNHSFAKGKKHKTPPGNQDASIEKEWPCLAETIV